MAGYRPGPEARRDPGETHPRRDVHDPHGPGRSLGPYGPREPDDAGDQRQRGPFEPYAAPAADGRRPAQPAPPGREPDRVPRAERGRPDRTGGADGNERLTGATGAVLLVLFAAEGFTILSIHQLITLHFFLGMLLIGPAALKAASVCYRFARYYTGAPDYRRKGPPAPLLRLLGPFVLGTSLGVLGTGVLLGVARSAAGPWLFLHKAFFVLWFGAMTIHVMAYAWRLPRIIGPDLPGSAPHHRAGVSRAREILAGRRARWLLLAASIVGGVLIALMTVHQAGPWTGAGHPG